LHRRGSPHDLRPLSEADAGVLAHGEERFLPAERLIGEALDIYTKQGDEIGMADAHHAFGNFYKHELYHTKFAPVFKRVGTYDGTYMRSIDNFSTAKRLFEKKGRTTPV
jgi:hypothetical protein